jgi:hypothetical protein
VRGEFALLARLSLPFVVRAHDFGVDTLTGAALGVDAFVRAVNLRSSGRPLMQATVAPAGAVLSALP